MRSALLLSFAAASLAAPAPAPGAHPAPRVPVSGKASLIDRYGNVKLDTYLGQLNYTLQKYKSPTLLPSLGGGFPDILKRASANEPLQDQGSDVLYYGPGRVGAKKPQTFVFDFDTGSSDTFIPGPSCDAAAGCAGTTRYNQGGQDEGTTTTVTYGSGRITGENYFDDLTVAGLRAKHQNVISLTQATGFSGAASNSLLGMAFGTIAMSRQPTYFENLISQGVIKTKEFSFYLGRLSDGTGSSSELTLGGRDSSKFTGTPNAVPVTRQAYWQVALDSVVVNDIGPVPSILGPDPTNGQAAIDTGTTLVVAPTEASKSIYARIPGAFPVSLLYGSFAISIWAYPCALNPSVELVFAGIKYAIDPRDFHFGRLTPDLGAMLGNNTLSSLLSEASYCLGAIASADIDPSQNLYVVGDTFIKNWYSIFSYDAAGGEPAVLFAKSI